MKIVKLKSKAKIQRKSSPLLSGGMPVSDSQREFINDALHRLQTSLNYGLRTEPLCVLEELFHDVCLVRDLIIAALQHPEPDVVGVLRLELSKQFPEVVAVACGERGCPPKLVSSQLQ